MSKIEELYDEIYSDIQTKSARVFIDFYELNKDAIEGEPCVLSNPDYDGIMRITADYALALSNYGSSKKSIPYLDKAIQLFKDREGEIVSGIPMYETLIWARGVENYNQKNYSLASKDFKYLVGIYPENDKYKNWLIASKTIKLKKYINSFWGTAVLFTIWESVVSKENTGFKHYLFTLSMIFFGCAIIAESANYLIKSKIKKR